MSETETLEYQSHDLVEGIVKDWVDQAVKTAGSGATDLSFLRALNEMRHLHLAEPWLITTKILNALKLAGWTPPQGAIEVTYKNGKSA